MHRFPSDAIALQPGILNGQYPEKPDIQPGRLDRIGHGLQGILNALSTLKNAGSRQIADAVEQKGKGIEHLTGNELAARVSRLRPLLRNQGLTFEHCAESFALIRETAARTLGLRHYNTQIMAGWAMLRGQLAEMETGEGKTLAATLAAATAALAGIPVHIITVNEYLVERDAETMGPLYEALGLSSACVTQAMGDDKRRQGYAGDIVYCTGKQVVFDYLRDRLVMGNTRSRLHLELESAYSAGSRSERRLLRGLCFAIVDEADSVLIDEAKTPFILTRNTDNTEKHAAYTGAMDLAGQLQPDIDFILDSAHTGISLTRTGQKKVEHSVPAGKGLWKNSRLNQELVVKALHACYLLHKDHHYLVREQKIVIIDANTGRTMPDRSWERGLHQMVELKENLDLTTVNEQLGRLTFQRFFRRYLKLGGMSGTAREVRQELWSVYRLPVRLIPLYRPSRRRALPTRIFGSSQEKWEAVTAVVADSRQKGRPVLIGTGSVADSETLSRILTRAGIDHQLLNARQDRQEALIVALAGQKGQVTVATNMAGRGTDIRLAEGVARLGGLNVLSTCCNEAGRIDRQLFGRCARQGDPGTYQTFLSLEDDRVRDYYPSALLNFLKKRVTQEKGLVQAVGRMLFKRAQKAMEVRHRNARRALLEHDRNTARLLAFSGHME